MHSTGPWPWRSLAQREPRFGALSSERTEFRILYDDRTIDFAIWAWDSDASGIRASELRRDSGLRKGDAVKLVIDTFHDHRNAFYFSTNPLGAYKDAQSVENGRTINYDWNAVWECKTHVDERGWYVESRRRFELVPFVTPSAQRDYSAGTPTEADAGYGFDMKIGVTSNLTADLTYRTDFAQVEADQEVVNLSRFSRFLPEKRQFFTESAGIYDFGQVGNSLLGGDSSADAGLLQVSTAGASASTMAARSRSSPAARSPAARAPTRSVPSTSRRTGNGCRAPMGPRSTCHAPTTPRSA